MKKISTILILLCLTISLISGESNNSNSQSNNSDLTNTNLNNNIHINPKNQIKIRNQTQDEIQRKTIQKRMQNEIRNIIRARNLTQEQKQYILNHSNKIQTRIQTECPENCTCSGATIKCQFEGGRVMNIIAGKSGNMIMQTKTYNVSTKVQLYKAEGKLFGVLKNNETKLISLMPDEVKERLKQKIKVKLEEGGEEIELNESGIYKIKTRKRARLLGFIPVKETINAEIDSETGEIIKTKNPWWSFMAIDVKEE